MRPVNPKKTPDFLEYTIVRRARVTRRLHMELDRQGRLVVVAPGHWTRKHIRATLAGNLPRVEQFLASAREKHQAPLRYVDGEVHYYLGEKYPLAVYPVAGNKTSIALIDGEIRLGTGLPQPEKIKIRLQKWYQNQAKMVFSERLEQVARKAPWTRDKTIPLQLRKMKRTWGNCSTKGVIKLNTHLVKAPLAAIDSVIAHELCHLQEMNHGKAFYALLENLNPRWREDRARLRSEGYIYLLT